MSGFRDVVLEQAQVEVDHAWTSSYSPEATARAIDAIADHPLGYRISHLIARLCFRGIYFPQMSKMAWVKLLFDNRRPILSLTVEGLRTWRQARKRQRLEARAVQTAQ